MSHSRLAALRLLIVLGVVVLPILPARSEPATEPDPKHQAALQRIQQLLDEPVIETSHFQMAMPLATFLTAVEKQLPKEKKLSLRIDGNAFGDKRTDVAATPMALPPQPKKIPLRRALEVAIARSRTKIDYALDATGVVMTTPKRACYTAGYDIRNLVAKPVMFSFVSPQIAVWDKDQPRNPDPTQKAARLVEALGNALDQESDKPTPTDQEAIQVLNGTRLVIHASAARHARIAEMLWVFRRLGDMSVRVQTQLYEVDEAFYTRVKKARRLSKDDLEELLRQTSDGIPETEDGLFKLLAMQKKLLDGLLRLIGRYNELFRLLAKEKMIQTGDEVNVDNGQEAVLLSRHQIVRCLPGPDQARRGEKARQTVVEGVSFLAEVQVSGDRRYVRVKLMEKSADLEGIDKVKVWDAKAEKDVVAETPFLKEATHSQVRDIPDNGSLLVPVHYRPRSLQAKEKWLVLSITPRIIILEEEEELRKGAIEAILPELITDILNNPNLKTTRELYGSPNDKRFALVNSDAWTWPKDFQPGIPDYEMVPPERMGKRLLGIRVDQYLDPGKEDVRPAITVTLVNAGGSANGAVIGGGTIRYIVKPGTKGRGVKLAEPPNP